MWEHQASYEGLARRKEALQMLVTVVMTMILEYKTVRIDTPRCVKLDQMQTYSSLVRLTRLVGSMDKEKDPRAPHMKLLETQGFMLMLLFVLRGDSKAHHSRSYPSRYLPTMYGYGINLVLQA